MRNVPKKIVKATVGKSRLLAVWLYKHKHSQRGHL